MPELPDLQVFSYNLQKILAGKKVKEVDVLVTKKLNVTVAELQSKLVNQELRAIKRVGKELQFEFGNGHVLALHLMLHGELSLFKGGEIPKFTILDIIFSNGTGLALSDFQKAATPTLDPAISDAPDALSANINADYFINLFKDKDAAVKNILLDQKLIRGIGNAYADEILWEARISPFSIAHKIPAKKIKDLVHAIKKVLQDAEQQLLKSHPDIISGEYREFLKIHGPKIKMSPAGAEVLVKKVGSRKTYYTSEQELFS
jgi:formamidopyrimidine-DNA glycosylase